MIHEEGSENVRERHCILSEAFINGDQAMGLTCLTQTQLRSNTVAVFDKSATLDTGQIVNALCEKYRTVIAGARNRLNGRVFRFGTIGAFDAEKILTELSQLESVLIDLGLSMPEGNAVTAATETFQRQGFAYTWDGLRGERLETHEAKCSFN